MPPIRPPLPNCYNWLVTTILSLGIVMPSYSYYAEKKLVYIAIASPSGRQPSSYTKCTKLNIRLPCNIQSVSNAKYTRLVILCDLLVPYFTYLRGRALLKRVVML